jgi:acyl-CoA thioester hydrolase
MELFESTFVVRWSDADVNGHLENKSYLEYCSQTRMDFFESHGFPFRDFARNALGPIVFRDEIDYHRELRMMERFTVRLELVGLSGDMRRFRLRNTFLRPDGEVSAVVTSTGGWFDLRERRLRPPPESLRNAIDMMPRAPDYAEIPSRET